MAVRFVYKPITEKPYVKCIPVEFVWEKGMALSQRAKSAKNLHNEAQHKGVATKLLECSRAGATKAGVKLSAFNLPFYGNPNIKVENVYQGSKVFLNKTTGKHEWLGHLYEVDAMTAKRCTILTDSNYEFKGFKLMETGLKFPTSPRHAFYNYIYMKSLRALLNDADIEIITKYDGFTDVMLKWYKGKVTSCQAHATAMLVGMLKAGVYDYHMEGSFEQYLEIYN